MDAGRLNHRVTIQTPTTSADAAGGVTQTWATFATVWARIEPLSAHRLFQAQQANADVTGVAHIRYLAGLEPTMRIKFGSRYLRIQSIIADERQVETQILYKEALD